MVIEGAESVFWTGCAGGVAAEVLHWWGLRESPQLPAYAKSVFYWAVTLAMVLAGGVLAWLYFGERAEALVAAHIGLSAPLMLQKLATSVPEKKGAKNIVVAPVPTLRRFFTW